ncbi:hypothetical protein MFLO_08787 [Listeria floridensis FSL S10-1187]|uniref:DUF4064 domain-containing protein n=1 Tax=Listeria floridensis FSL S10-1187 TaxID=1265817 RepID=A0ABN0REY1_9LIST|nr:DUF4064 domain-containing protein [Listeria floridensis]EUJ31513.1 hypothetical protein MFLO_08787 [Listeria floridensis FSL S10-1187]
MIKRTGEVVLSVIGLVLAFILQGGLTYVAFSFVNATKTKAGYDSFVSSYERTVREAGVNLSDAPAASKVIDTLSNFSTFFVVALIAMFILAVLGLVFIIGNKKPVLAGFLFLFAGICVTAATFLVGFIPALLFLIAAIMCWVRKPKNDGFADF